MPLKFDRKTDLIQLYSTPLGRFMLADAKSLTPRIADVILAKEAADPGIARSNKGGWHSDLELLQWPELKFADLENVFREAIFQMISVTTNVQKFKSEIKLSAWANVNRAGSTNNSHVHPSNHWSGVFYVKTPDFSSDPIKGAGNLQLHDPRGAIHMLENPCRRPDEVIINPMEGGILIFPSWLFHSVNTFSLNAVRISIAFNARILDFEPVRS